MFFGGKNSSNKFEIKIVGKKRHQCGALAKSISAPSVRANEVGSLKHEVGSEVGSVVDIDRRTSINSMPMRPLRPSVRDNENSSRS